MEGRDREIGRGAVGYSGEREGVERGITSRWMMRRNEDRYKEFQIQSYTKVSSGMHNSDEMTTDGSFYQSTTMGIKAMGIAAMVRARVSQRS